MIVELRCGDTIVRIDLVGHLSATVSLISIKVKIIILKKDIEDNLGGNPEKNPDGNHDYSPVAILIEILMAGLRPILGVILLVILVAILRANPKTILILNNLKT